MYSPESASHKLESAAARRSSWRTAYAALLGDSDERGLVSHTGTSANASTILSQNRLRIAFVVVGAAFLGTLRLAAAQDIPRAAWLLAAGYVAVVFFVGAAVRSAKRAGLASFVALVLADLSLIYAAVPIFAAPSHFAAALFLSLIALQFAHAFLGVLPALLVVGGSVLGYVALVTDAVERGTLRTPATELWILVLYLAVAVYAIVRQARFNRRLATIVDLFAHAERGDFEHAYDERRDRSQDGLTLVGRAYNHLRGELAALVLTDPLTGCLNRRGFEQELARAVARAAREGGGAEVGLLAVDIDRFKRVNDTFGHLAGDTVLRELAEVVMHSARTGDIVGRVGGDELVVLLPGADLEAAGVVAERIADVVRAHHFITRRGRERVTVSVGIAAEHVRDPYVAHALRARADEALYVAKRLGRDRVVLWAPGIRSQATPPQTFVAVEQDAPHRSGRGLRRLERAD